MRIGITGVTISANMGGQSMLLATLESLPKATQSSINFVLFSVYPDRDKKLLNGRFSKLEICALPPFLLLLGIFPLCIIAYPLRFLGIRHLLARLPVFREIAKLDAVVDLSGIAFVDGRGFPLLMYNVAIVLPFLLMKVPVMKLSQALGPFKNPLNFLLGRWTLKRCQIVRARGDQSLQNLTPLQLQNCAMSSDTAFSMKVEEADQKLARQALEKIKDLNQLYIISPSRVVSRMVGEEIFLDRMQELISRLLKDGRTVLILAHSLGEGASKNNDVVVCQELFGRFPKSENLHCIADIADAPVLRAILSHARVFMGCRFHSIVSALIMGVPTAVVGWSHKYDEMVRQFGVEIPVFPYSGWSVEALYQALAKLELKRDSLAQRLLEAQASVLRSSFKNYEDSARLLQSIQERKQSERSFSVQT